MGRIAWFDAKARKVIGDIRSFNTQLGVMQKDLLFYTWMHERYGCDGKMQTNRTAAYFEYPSTVAILLREIRYGIFLSFDHITVDPIDPSQPFSYHIGNVNVDYQPNGTSTVRVPVSGAAGFWRTAGTPSAAQGREFRVHGMVALGRYAVDEAEYTCDAARAFGAAVSTDIQPTRQRSAVAGPDGTLRFRAHALCGVSITLMRG